MVIKRILQQMRRRVQLNYNHRNGFQIDNTSRSGQKMSSGRFFMLGFTSKELVFMLE